jgi:phosphoribosylaminoimidazole carboxylase/phosphoribosylaminoimidazole-succinocarboxamide synthase
MVPTFIFLPGSNEKVVLIAVAGRSNGLGPVLSGNTSFPVINCPPVKPENVAQDIWSSLNVPSGEVYYCTILHQEVSLSTSTLISVLEAFGLSLCQDINHLNWWLL